jgi:DNA-binding transcriptional ArsR family regulator
MLDCVDVGFIPDGTLDELPTPSRIGATRVGGVDLNKPRIRAVLAAVLALAAAPDGFTVTDLTAKVHTMTGRTHTDYTTRQAAYDLRKLRGKHLVDKPGRTRRYRVPDLAARTIAALLALRDQIIGPLIAGVRSPRMGRKPLHWTQIDRDYETLRIGMHTLFSHLGVTPNTAA